MSRSRCRFILTDDHRGTIVGQIINRSHSMIITKLSGSLQDRLDGYLGKVG